MIETTKNVNLKQNNSQSGKKVIPIFFASDANYLPYLSVSLDSLIQNASKNYAYHVYILHTGITKSEQERVLNFNDEIFSVSFVNVANKVEEVRNSLQLRDYYTGATYYRIFIANMFPQYDKALYLDSDTVVLGDVSKLYNFDLGDNLVGAISDSVIGSHPVFQRYTKEVLGVEPKKYFNAGILLMNLKKFRKDDFYSKFRALLKEYKFSVAQDQDYLNVLCKDNVRYIPLTWNTMPIGGESKKAPCLVHYNLTAKPWHYADIPYAKHFWKYAEKSAYCEEIRREFGAYDALRKQKDTETEAGLIALAKAECEREDNFIKARKKAELKNKTQFDVFESLFAEAETPLTFEDFDFTVVGAKR